MNRPIHGDEWLSWFDALKTSGDIRDAAYAPAQVLESLDAMPLERAVDLVGDAMDEIYIPIPEHVQILQILWEQAKGHSYAVYPTIGSSVSFNALRSIQYAESKCQPMKLNNRYYAG